MKWLVIIGVVVMGAVAASAQRGPAAAPVQESGITPAEIQRMFDAYALLQAQEQLKIGDEQYSQFLTRFKALQDIRRKSLQERTRIVNELRRMLNDGQADDAQIKERL